MKKILLIGFLIFSMILLSSCNISGTLNSILQKNDSIGDYFSYAANTKYIYEGKGNEYASYTVFVDYIEGNRVQTRTNNGGTETVKVFENKDGELTSLYSMGETYYRENLLEKSNDIFEVVLKEPLKKGTTWIMRDKINRYISNTDVKITTKSGKYNALEVTTDYKDSKTLDYYAPGIGLIKSIYKSVESEISSELVKKEKNVELSQTVRFYYPNADEDKIYYLDKQISFKTNDITKVALEKSFKELPAGNFGKVLGPNAKIKNLYINDENIVYVNFSKELLSEMNAGSGYEGMILQCITNTLGGYYATDKVYITVEGKPYSSGHFEMKKGEYFTVDLKNSYKFE